MLSSVNVYSSWLGATNLAMSGVGIEKDLVQILSIDGLGPVKATINTTPFGSVDGEAFSGSVVPKREIVMHLALNPDWVNFSMEDLRRIVYSYFMSKQKVRLVFYSDDDFPTVEIYGYTEAVEPVMFSKNGELQVTIICPDPYFTGIDPVGTTGTTESGVTIDYAGSVPSGVNVRVTARAFPSPTINWLTIRTNSLVPELNLHHDLTPQAYFEMNSVSGNKYAHFVDVTGSGVITSVLPNITTFGWPILIPGPNDFSVASDVGVADWSLTFYERFGGL